MTKQQIIYCIYAALVAVAIVAAAILAERKRQRELEQFFKNRNPDFYEHPEHSRAEWRTEVATISDTVHNDPKEFQRLYQSVGESLGGFPGIWVLCAECAIELDRQHPDTAWDDGNYIETCEAIGKRILNCETDPKKVVLGALLDMK